MRNVAARLLVWSAASLGPETRRASRLGLRVSTGLANCHAEARMELEFGKESRDILYTRLLYDLGLLECQRACCHENTCGCACTCVRAHTVTAPRMHKLKG